MMFLQSIPSEARVGDRCTCVLELRDLVVEGIDTGERGAEIGAREVDGVK